MHSQQLVVIDNPMSNSWLKKLDDTLDIHLKCPDVALDTYRSINRIQLAYSVLRKRRIYLDTLVWIRLRDVEMGRSTDSTYKALLDVLRDACGRDQLICPLSCSAVSELLNQEDRATRLATARIMDDLSQAVCIQRFDYLLSSELEHLLCKTLLPEHTHAVPEDLAWTKVAFFVGQPTLSADVLSPTQLLAMQKSIDDAMLSVSVETLASRFPSNRRQKFVKKSTLEAIAKLNVEKVKPAHLLDSYQQFVESEVWGALEVFEQLLGQTMSRLAQMAGFDGKITEADRKAGADMLRRLIGNAYKFNRISSEVPQLHINSSLHALVRYDHKRKYKPGDLEDFRHAGAALPYCHVFLTEKSLAHMLHHPPAAIVDHYSCQVFSDPTEALEHIRAVAA